MADESGIGSFEGVDEPGKTTPEAEEVSSDDVIAEAVANAEKNLEIFRIKGDNTDPDYDPDYEPLEEPNEPVVKDEGTEDEGEEEEGTEAEGTEVVEEGTEVEGEGEAEAEAAGQEADSPTLPAAYRRSLLASEWTDKEIDDFFVSNPDGAMVFAEKVHRTRNAQTAQFAAAGREAQAQAQRTNAPEAPPPEMPGGFERIDTDALIDKFGGNEEVIAAIAGPMNKVIDQMNVALPKINANVEASENTRRQSLGQAIEDFFTGADMKSFAGIYGDSSADSLAVPTDDQQQSRDKVLETADAIMTGARMQGRQLTVPEALTMAHDSLSVEYRTEVARTELKTKVKKRASGVTLKPSAAKTKAESGSQPTTRAQLESNVAEQLAKTFA